MYWTDIPCNELLNRVFKSPPEIGEIDLFEIDINRDGPTVILNFDLVDILPDNPPVKWGKDFNRCRMGVYCLGVHDLSLTGLAANILAKIDFQVGEEMIGISICGDNFRMSFKCVSVTVTGPSVYKSN